MRDEVSAPVEEKLRLIADLDERIAQSRGAERRALVRGTCLGVAMFAAVGALPNTVDVLWVEVFRYAGSGLLVFSEFLVRRAARRRLERKQDQLMAPTLRE